MTPTTLTDRVTLLEAHLKLLEARIAQLTTRHSPADPMPTNSRVTEYPQPGAGASRNAIRLARRAG